MAGPYRIQKFIRPEKGEKGGITPVGSRIIFYLLIWTAFYEQLAWAPILVDLAANAGDPEAVALAASAYSLANLGGNLLFGIASDRVGRLRVAGAGLLAMAATAFLHLLASTPDTLVGARFLHGLAAATVAPVALAGVSASAPGHRRGEAMARAGLLIALASMAAPPMTGRIADLVGVPTAVFVLMGGIFLTGVIVLAAARTGDVRWGPAGWRPSAAAASGDRTGPASTAPGPGARGSLIERPDRFDPVLAIIATLVGFALMFGQNVLFYALPLKGHGLGLPAARIGALLSAFALGALIAFVPPLSRLSDRFGRRMPLLLGLGLTAAGLLGLAAGRTELQMALSLFLYGFGFGLTFPSVTALSADATGVGRRGAAYGLATAAFSAGAITGPLVARSLGEMLSPFAVAALAAAAGAAVVVAGMARIPAVTRPRSPEG